ncbi:MAG: hypothetical protein ACI8UO_000191 [Verrucomicrobiales bacterium]|jgi:uncharacterized protein (UPF0276 family)
MLPDIHTRPYGVGLAYRYVIQDGCLENRDHIDLLELPTEDYIIRQRRVNSDPNEQLLAEATSIFPSVAHGISMSIGTVQPLSSSYLSSTLEFMRRHNIEVFSEHLAFHEIDGKDLTIFLTMPFEEAAVQWIAQNYKAARAALGRPFALENVTYHFGAPNPTLSEPEFFSRIAEECDCSFLLDVTNVFNNAHNHGYDPIDFLDRYPLDRVTQLHLAGGHFMDGKWEDSHSKPVMMPVWDLFEEIVRRTSAEIVILERDSHFHPFDLVMNDLHRAREIFYKHRPAHAPSAERPFELFKPQPLGGEPDCLALEFEQLRKFQRAVFGRITDPDFRADFAADRAKTLNAIGLNPEWRERVELCDPKSMLKLEATWDALSQMYQNEAEEFEQQEWAAWANVLESEADAA